MDFLSRQDSKFFESKSGPRMIRVLRNGDNTLGVDIVLKPSITFQQLKAEILQKLGLKNTNKFRLFNSEGIELYDDYIPLIKDQENIYVSLGEEFDQNTSLDDYVVIKTLGEGGFGKVALARHSKTNKMFAIKYVDAKQYGLASLIDMVFSEAELLKNLKHKNIVEIVSFFTLKDLRVVFVMEYLEGGELGDYLNSKGRLDENEARNLFKQLADAVYFCHMNKIIHRDLKLENIIFESKDSNIIKVVDFGIAGLYSGYKFDVSDAGSLKYMAPEILTGENKAANPAMDVWSMGCILYALLHGYLPFRGNAREIRDAIIKGEYSFDTEIKRKLSPECIDLIKQMLNVDYTTRIPTYEVKIHPWLTGEKSSSFISNKQEEAKGNERTLKLNNESISRRKDPLNLVKQNKERQHSTSISSYKEKKNEAEGSKTENSMRIPGQNTLRRAISREARTRTEGTQKDPKRPEVRSSFYAFKPEAKKIQ